MYKAYRHSISFAEWQFRRRDSGQRKHQTEDTEVPSTNQETSSSLLIDLTTRQNQNHYSSMFASTIHREPKHNKRTLPSNPDQERAVRVCKILDQALSIVQEEGAPP